MLVSGFLPACVVAAGFLFLGSCLCSSICAFIENSGVYPSYLSTSMIRWWWLIPVKWLISAPIMDGKPNLVDDSGKKNNSKIHEYYHYYLGSIRVRKSWWKKLLGVWVISWIIVCSCIFRYMNSHFLDKRKETLGSMCDERSRMLQDQFNVSLNHIQAMSILISTFHHGKNPSAIDQETFARYTERTAFERPLTSGVAYAVRVLHSEREEFEKEQGWSIKSMNTMEEQTPVHEDDYAVDNLKPSPVQQEYAPVIFAQDTISHVVSVDVLSGKEDRENVLRARTSGKGVLTAPFPLLKTGRLGVILTFAVYKRELPSNATPNEWILATDGYLGGVFDVESLVEKLLQQLASKQKILVNVYDTTNLSNPISMYGSEVSGNDLEHVSHLNFGDPFRRHEMRCRFKQKPPWPWLAITTAAGILVIAFLVGHIFHATLNRIAKVEDDCQKMMVLKKQAEAADVAKSRFLATVSHEIRTPMNGVLGMLDMLIDTHLDVTQQDYVRTAQASGKALVSLINEVLDQAKIEAGKLELDSVTFDLRAIMDDVLSLFSGKSQEKGVELALYISEQIPELVVGDPGRFRQIITNLIGNSIKFTERGHIFVTVHLVEEVRESIKVGSELSTLSGFPVADTQSSWVGFKAFSEEEEEKGPNSSNMVNLIVSVEDTGCGIPVEAQSRIFTPFMQVGPRNGGTGIGLSISKCLVSLMTGEIGFASIPKVGSTFTFTVVFSIGCSTSSNGKLACSEFQGMTALVVDPKQVRVKVSRYHIQRLGMHIEVASDLNQTSSLLVSVRNRPIDVVLIEEEVWSKDLKASSGFVSGLKNAKLFILTNNNTSSSLSSSSSSISRDSDSVYMMMKPLRASRVAASLQRAMGVVNKGNNNTNLPIPLHSVLVGRKILVVDDNKINLKVAAGALRKYGAEVECVESGKIAIEKLKAGHKYDACFMDIQMPEMDGFEATRIIRERERENGNKNHVPILAMTADVIHATHEECSNSGMDGYVSKPFEAQQLYQEVSRFFPEQL